jgi:dTDP-4-dehydrorhamnose reductase
MNILGTGLSGLVGSRISEIMAPKYTFENLSLETGVDITKPDEVNRRIAASDAAWVFHFAAYTDVQGAEKEKDKGKDSVAWKVNVDATATVIAACQKTGKHMLYLSTDYVFDGKEKEYTEAASPNPQGWYTKTKFEGEKLVGSLGEMGLTIRISNPYRANPVGKRDWVHKMMDRMREGQSVAAPTDQLFTPTFIDDLAFAIDKLIAVGGSGVVHAGGSAAISPYDAALEIAKIFKYDEKLVGKSTFAEYSKNRAPYPQYAALKNNTLEAMGVVMRGFGEGLAEVARQEV